MMIMMMMIVDVLTCMARRRIVAQEASIHGTDYVLNRKMKVASKAKVNLTLFVADVG